jgi:hypothetical protein
VLINKSIGKVRRNFLGATEAKNSGALKKRKIAYLKI